MSHSKAVRSTLFLCCLTFIKHLQSPISSNRLGGMVLLAHLYGACTRSLLLQPYWLLTTRTSKLAFSHVVYLSLTLCQYFFRTAVEARGQFAAAGRYEGNENRRWHGTRRICNLGDKGHTQFCSSPSCSLCCIIRTSYDITLWGKKTGWGRFGKGIYTSSTSSKLVISFLVPLIDV